MASIACSPRTPSGCCSSGSARTPSKDDPTELRLLLNLIFRANGCSERFRSFVLKAVEHSVLPSDQALYGSAARRAGAIDKADVEVIRRLIYGSGSQRGIAISRAEAEFLFELNRATARADNDPRLARSVRQGDHDAHPARRRLARAGRRAGGDLAQRPARRRLGRPRQRAGAARLPASRRRQACTRCSSRSIGASRAERLTSEAHPANTRDRARTGSAGAGHWHRRP